jgi:uncharacterized protein YndB with AHSA1/START domain
MADIFHEFIIKVPCQRVFQAVATPEGLDRWWTMNASGGGGPGAEVRLFFGPDYDWRGRVVTYEPDSAFEIEITEADPDWVGSHVGFRLESQGAAATRVLFHHTGWPHANQHWRISCYCWAMYLRILRRYLEHNEVVPYPERLDV